MGNTANEAFFEAYMNQGKAIGDAGAVLEIAVATGLNEAEVRSVLNSDRYLDAVRKDQQSARELEITGVPYFVINEKYVLTGAQPRESFRKALSQARLDSLNIVAADGVACGESGCSI